jgi:hypothetical protein
MRFIWNAWWWWWWRSFVFYLAIHLLFIHNQMTMLLTYIYCFCRDKKINYFSYLSNKSKNTKNRFFFVVLFSFQIVSSSYWLIISRTNYFFYLCHWSSFIFTIVWVCISLKRSSNRFPYYFSSYHIKMPVVICILMVSPYYIESFVFNHLI